MGAPNGIGISEYLGDAVYAAQSWTIQNYGHRLQR